MISYEVKIGEFSWNEAGRQLRECGLEFPELSN